MNNIQKKNATSITEPQMPLGNETSTLPYTSKFSPTYYSVKEESLQHKSIFRISCSIKANAIFKQTAMYTGLKFEKPQYHSCMLRSRVDLETNIVLFVMPILNNQHINKNSPSTTSPNPTKASLRD